MHEIEPFLSCSKRRGGGGGGGKETGCELNTILLTMHVYIIVVCLHNCGL